MSSYHEPQAELSATARDTHRAMASLIEELEAADWYGQRIEVATAPELKDILAHNRDEELEHASMLLEWLRRRMPELDTRLRTYLFADGPIVGLEQGGAQGGTANEALAPRSDLGVGRIRKES